MIDNGDPRGWHPAMPLPQPVAHDRLARAVIDALAHYELELARGNATGGMTEMARLLRRGWGPPS